MDSWLKEALMKKECSLIKDDMENIANIQRIFADYFPFENLDVLLKSEESITPDFLYDKMISRRRGGLCYEINPLLFLILKELGMNVFLAAATVKIESGWATDRTHVLNLFEHDGKLFAVDNGFGSNLPLRPLELDGPQVQSPAGCYRLRSKQTEKGSAVLESKKGDDWVVRYAFYPEKMEWSELDNIRSTIHNSPHSAFNQGLLIAQVLEEGTLTINEERLSLKHSNGNEQRVAFASLEEAVESVSHHFAGPIRRAAIRYLEKRNSGERKKK